MNPLHTFHIPVMGSGFTIDTALRVSPYGINSVLSLVDDVLMEKIRKVLCKQHELPFIGIDPKRMDCRAERITAYLNLLDDLSKKRFDKILSEAIASPDAADAYFGMLPDSSPVSVEYKRLRAQHADDFGQMKEWIIRNMVRGSIDVNIMTKLDRPNFYNGEKLPAEYNDAHSALRGFAHSKLSASVVLSAGLNPELYGYMAGFPDFFPDSKGNLMKKIVIKVSDYRSAMIQGKFLAKKGLWVSEFRVESGLNCGGHAFGTSGLLMGIILKEFREKREDLVASMYESFSHALSDAGHPVPLNPLPVLITAQGGIGTAAEHSFLITHYGLDSVGWGTPFLLVPEVTLTDNGTIEKLLKAGTRDVLLSDTSPLQIPFYTLKGNTRDEEKEARIDAGLPGSPCPRRYLALNRDYSEQGQCLASFEYQNRKLQELEALNLPAGEFKKEFETITQKSCICAGLGTPALKALSLNTTDEGPGESVCPSPNIAWFNRIASFSEMVDHIYGRINLIEVRERPNVFITEMFIYIDFLKKEAEKLRATFSKKQLRHLQSFAGNLKEGIAYYRQLFEMHGSDFGNDPVVIQRNLQDASARVEEIGNELQVFAGC